MNDTLLSLAHRREQLVARSARQRQQLVLACSPPVLGSRGGRLWEQLRLWGRPAAMLVAPLVLVVLVRRPGWVLRGARWLWPAWQAWRAAQRLIQSRSGL